MRRAPDRIVDVIGGNLQLKKPEKKTGALGPKGWGCGGRGGHRKGEDHFDKTSGRRKVGRRCFRGVRSREKMNQEKTVTGLRQASQN